MKEVAVIGAGALGTALAQTVAENVDEVYLHLRREELKEEINNTRFNNEYYPNTQLKDNIIATTDYNDIKDCKVIILAIPSSAFRSVLKDIKGLIREDTILVTTAKGIEYPSLKTMGKIIEEYFDDEYVALSGPNFASEIMLRLSTVSNIASRSNENARYGVLTKGFTETKEIIKSIGGEESTASEYCGFGDLVLTSTSLESRNHTLGMLYGQRLIIDEKASGVVFEGKNSIMAMKDICNNYNIQSVIVDFVYDVIVNRIPPKIAFRTLWGNIE